MFSYTPGTINLVNEEEALRTFVHLEQYGGLEDLLPGRMGRRLTVDGGNIAIQPSPRL